MSMVRLLGPVAVVDDEGALHFPASPIRRTLLAVLALQPRSAIDADVLLDRAWDGAPPDSGLAALRFHISRLRAEVGRDVVVTDRHGYRIDATTDLAEVEDELDNGDGPVEQLRAAVERWDGASLGGVSSCSVLEHERLRVEEIRLTLIERLLRREAEEGDPESVVARLTVLCNEHPFREGFWAALITAQSRVGNQAEALRSYGRLCRRLRDTLGVEPSAELRDLHAKILVEDPALAPEPRPLERGGSTRPGSIVARRELIGRDDEVARVVELAGDHRLLTVVGTGGIGKTSIVHALVEELRATPGAPETWWCDLATARDGDVALRIGRSVGLVAAADPVHVGVGLGLGPPGWLVLDNCEHVIGAVEAVVCEVLGRSATHVVATSRVAIGHDDEVVYPLGPLADAAAVELFVARAARLEGADVDAFDNDAVHSICGRVDGIPLAIELVASRTRALALADIESRLARLLDPVRALAGERDRHATMAGVVASSVDLLDEDVATSLGALSVFAGGFDLGDAEVILADETDIEPMMVIDELVANSLLEADTTGPTARYRILEPIRQYTERHLWRDPTRTRHTHLDHFLDKLEAAYQVYGESSCGPLLAVYRDDIENLGVAHRWALESGRIADDLRIYRPLLNDWIRFEMRPCRWAQETIRATDFRSVPGWPAVVFQALAGELQVVDVSHVPEIEEMLDTVADEDPARDIADSLRAFIIGWIYDDWARAAPYYRRSRASGDPNLVSLGYHFGALCPPPAASDDEAPDPVRDALTLLEEGLTWARSIGARDAEAMLLQRTAQTLGNGARYEESARCALEGRSLADDLGLVRLALWCDLSIAVASMMGVDRTDCPEEMLAQQLVDCARSMDGTSLVFSLPVAARLLLDNDEPELAALCETVPAMTPVMVRPLAPEELSDETREQAARDAQHLSMFEIAERAALTLRSVGDPKEQPAR